MGTVSPFTIFDCTSGLISSKNFVSFQLYTQISSGQSNRTINLCRLKHLSGVKLLNVVTNLSLSKKWNGESVILIYITYIRENFYLEAQQSNHVVRLRKWSQPTNGGVNQRLTNSRVASARDRFFSSTHLTLSCCVDCGAQLAAYVRPCLFRESQDTISILTYPVTSSGKLNFTQDQNQFSGVGFTSVATQWFLQKSITHPVR